MQKFYKKENSLFPLAYLIPVYADGGILVFRVRLDTTDQRLAERTLGSHHLHADNAKDTSGSRGIMIYMKFKMLARVFSGKIDDGGVVAIGFSSRVSLSCHVWMHSECNVEKNCRPQMKFLQVKTTVSSG